MRRCVTRPPGAVSQARLLGNQEGANAERYVVRKLSARRFQWRPLWHRWHCSNSYHYCGDINHGKSAQGCDIRQPFNHIEVRVEAKKKTD